MKAVRRTGVSVQTNDTLNFGGLSRCTISLRASTVKLILNRGGLQICI